MKSKRVVSLIGLLTVVALLVYIAFFGIGTEDYGIASVEESMKLGLDIQGGVVLEYEAVIPDSITEEADIRRELDGTKAVMSTRIDSKGLMEPKVTVDYSARRIRVEMPGVSDVNEAAQFIGTTAKLTFHKVAEGVELDRTAVENGQVLVGDFDGVEIMDGGSVKDSGSRFVSNPGNYTGYVVDLELDSDGAKAFETATLEFVNRESKFGVIAIAVDGIVISAPRATEVISSGECYISNMDQQKAYDLSLQIRSGALPLELIEIESSLIGPTLGQDALTSSINAAKVGFLMVILFMLFYYKVPGMIASVALVLYATIILFTMVGLQATLTLPGVAGIVLGLGMAVDANVVIFERLKEELRNGKTVRAAIKTGFKRAMRTIMDANITTLIAAAVLYGFGEGPIKGFATTLGIGIVASMFTAVVFTRTLLVTVDALGLFKNRRHFGA